MHIPLEERVRIFAKAELDKKLHVTLVDVLRDTGLLDNSQYFAWIDGRSPHLEAALSAKASLIDAMAESFHAWAQSLNLRSQPAVYLSASRHPSPLRFSDDEARTHKFAVRYFSPSPSDAEIGKFQR